MSDEKLFEESMSIFEDEWYRLDGVTEPERHRRAMRAALAVFEKALGEATVTPSTPTDDEREALAQVIFNRSHTPDDALNLWDGDIEKLADAILAAGFRRTEIPEPSAVLAERERAALHAQEGYRMGENCDDIAKRIRSGEPAAIGARPEPQGEPSDAAADAAQQGFHAFTFGPDGVDAFLTPERLAANRPGWKAALRAASAVTAHEVENQ